MIAMYEDLMIWSLEVVVPLLHSVHNGQDLPIVRVVVLFGTLEISAVEVDRSENPENIVLVENAGNGEAACISLQNNQFSQF